MGNNPSWFTGDNRPVETVNWYHAIAFCNRLSILEGLSPAYRIGGSTDPEEWIATNAGSIPTTNNATWNAVEIVAGSTGYRLPTEAQWEYACRAGTTTGFNWGTNQITSDQANFYAIDWLYNDSPAGIFRNETTDVGTFAANAFGLYDKHGNVWEWCWHWYGSYDYAGGYTNPAGPEAGSMRVIRGRSFGPVGQWSRSAYRGAQSSWLDNPGIGFRLALPGN